MKRICEQLAGELLDVPGFQVPAEGCCPVEQALRIAKAAAGASCGKAVMCREGLLQLYHIILDCAGMNGKSEDVDLLRELCEAIETANDCELSVRAAGLIHALLENNPEEWDMHIRRKRCGRLSVKPEPIHASVGGSDESAQFTRRRRRRNE